MMHEMRKKTEPTLLPTQAIFDRPHHIGMVREEKNVAPPVGLEKPAI